MQRCSEMLKVWGVLALLCVGLPGCGAENGTKVIGTVTLDGTPLAEGAIAFVPADGKTASSAGTISNGLYSVELPPGPKKVEITASKVVGQRQAYEGQPDSPMVDITESIIPDRYNRRSELTIEVQPGKNTQDFDLEP